jgi:hypothetical protein
MTQVASASTEELARLEQQYLLAASRTGRRVPSLPPAARSIPFTEIAEDTSGGPLATEWNFYRREVGRLLAEGHENRWLLIRGEQIVGMWDTEEEADRVRLDRYSWESILLKQVLTREPVYRVRGASGRWH